MSADYHADFWVAVTTAAPVLVLAHAVVIQRFDASIAAVSDLLKVDAFKAEAHAIEDSGAALRRDVERLRKAEKGRPAAELADLTRRLDDRESAIKHLREALDKKAAQLAPLRRVSRAIRRRMVLAAVGILLAFAPFVLGLTALADERDWLTHVALYSMNLSMLCVVIVLMWGRRIRAELRLAGMSPDLVAD